MLQTSLKQRSGITEVLTAHWQDSRFTSGRLLFLLARVVKEPLSAAWTGLTQGPVHGH